MSNTSRLHIITTKELLETYQTLYESHHKLGLDDTNLLSTTKCPPEDQVGRRNLVKLLHESKSARDNLITWYLKLSLVELNVTISLLTAKIKFIEYKLGSCDGLELHQACSLSLIDFCNILSDMTVVNVSPSERKTLKQVSAEVGVPVWLSHYRNQICHVPSESPCISILVPLVVKSLNYMRESFWSKVIEHESFDEPKFKKCMNYIARLTYVTSMNKRLHVKKSPDLSRKRAEKAADNLVKYSRVCLMLRRTIAQNPRQSLDILSRFLSSTKFKDSSRNASLLLEQIIFAKQFENFFFKLVSLVEEDPESRSKYSLLKLIVRLVGLRKSSQLKGTLNQMELSASPHIKNLTDVSSVKCCQAAYRLAKINYPKHRKLVILMRQKLLPLIGKEKLGILIDMTKLMSDVKV